MQTSLYSPAESKDVDQEVYDGHDDGAALQGETEAATVVGGQLLLLLLLLLRLHVVLLLLLAILPRGRVGLRRVHEHCFWIAPMLKSINFVSALK